MAENFFEMQAEQSAVKTAIVLKYFDAWAKVIQGHLASEKKRQTIAYIGELNAGLRTARLLPRELPPVLLAIEEMG